jgi:mycoredoxin
MENKELIIVYATRWCPDCLRTRRLLDQKNVQYTWIDIDQDKEAKEYVMKVNHGNRSVPTIVFPDGSILVEPSTTELSSRIGL